MVTPLELHDESLERVDELASVDDDVLALLAALPPAQRRAIAAHVIDERPYADIAAEMRCSPLVVRQRVSRGLAALRSQMEDAS